DVRDWAASTRLASGERVIDAEWVQLSLARVHAKVEFLKLLNWRVASSGGSLGPAAVVRSGSPGEVLAGRIERAHRAALILTFGGGTNEVQRDIIAATGLGLPFS